MHRNIRSLSADEHIELMRTKSSDFWQTKESKRKAHIFKKAALEVPAYQAFLKKKQYGKGLAKDWISIPPTSKKTYLQAYPLASLCWNGDLNKPLVFTSTSGSTGKPFYFPREEQLDWQSSIVHELFFINNKVSLRGPTLIVVCFSMGVWIGGLITYQAFEMTREKGYPFSILTPGINKEEIFKALRQIAPQFKQIIMVGYAPFIKDIVDEAEENGINIKKLRPRFIFAAEAFTEKFRDYITEKAGIDNALTDTMNIYGSADIGSMAFETPIAILLRRIAMTKPKLFAALFGDVNRTPTLAQYNPLFISFEAIDGELYLTGDNAIPLIRYRIGDHGGRFSFKEAARICKEYDVDLVNEARKAGVADSVYELPFVYVYERIDLSTTIYGLQVYPETIREVLLEKEFHAYLTGKLTLITKFDREQNQYIEVNVELRKNKKMNSRLKKRLLSKVLTNLLTKNSEFKELYAFLGKRAIPKIVEWENGDELHFRSGIKQRWVKKNV